MIRSSFRNCASVGTFLRAFYFICQLIFDNKFTLFLNVMLIVNPPEIYLVCRSSFLPFIPRRNVYNPTLQTKTNEDLLFSKLLVKSFAERKRKNFQKIFNSCQDFNSQPSRRQAVMKTTRPCRSPLRQLFKLCQRCLNLELLF